MPTLIWKVHGDTLLSNIWDVATRLETGDVRDLNRLPFASGGIRQEQKVYLGPEELKEMTHSSMPVSMSHPHVESLRNKQSRNDERQNESGCRIGYTRPKPL